MTTWTRNPRELINKAMSAINTGQHNLAMIYMARAQNIIRQETS